MTLKGTKMICPKCKGKNSTEEVVCPSCGFKLKTICPRCKEPNKLGQPQCVKCNLILIRFCPDCKTPNFPHIKNCRKCGFELIKVKQEKEPEIKPEPQIQSEPEPEKQESPVIELKKEVTRNGAIKFLTDVLAKSDKGYLISLCAPEGLGKSTVVSSASQLLKNQKITWINGMCEPYKQHIPYAFFQDLISALFGIPVFSLNNDDIKKSLKKIFETSLEVTDEAVLKAMYKIVLNEHEENDNSIEKNRNEIYKAFHEIITAFNKKTRVVLIVDDFEYIDKASFDCLKYLLKKDFLANKNFMIINHSPVTNIAKLFPAEISSQKMAMLLIKPLTSPELDAVMLTMLNNQNILPESLKNRIFSNSKGMPIYVEQALWYLFQLGAIYPDQQELKFKSEYKDVAINPELHGLFMQRLSIIEKLSPQALNVIFIAALLGMKFIPKLIEMATGIKEKEMQQIMQLLVNSGIIVVYDQYNFGFKHISLWKIIYERTFNDEQIKQSSLHVLSVLKGNPSIKNSFLTKLAELAENNENLLHYYNNAVEESYYLGDTLSYTNNQVKLLELLPNSGLIEKEKESAKILIKEQIGKVNFESNPTLAMDYLKESIKTQEEQNNQVKVIELTGYLSRSCELAGNYQGVLDCAEKAINITANEDNNSNETILLNFTKLDALFNLGRLEETIMTARNEILPFLNKALLKNEAFPGLNTADIKDIEYQTEFTLAKALTYQGNVEAEELLKKIAAKAEKENNIEYEIKALLGQALLLTIQGDLRGSDEILEKLSRKEFTSENSDPWQLEWLTITTLSHLLNGNFEKARSICYTALPLAKECRDYNLFSLLKVLNGMFYQHFQYHNNAVAIYDEVAQYCSENKMATGALFAWYFAAKAELETGNPNRAEEIAEKAMDVAQKPNINNLITAILLARLLSEIKTAKGDFEGAQIYIENGITLAEKNKLNHILAELYLTFGKIYHENAAVKGINKEQTSNYAQRLYLKALRTAEKLDNNFLIGKIEKEISNLQAFCNLSGFTLANEV